MRRVAALWWWAPYTAPWFDPIDTGTWSRCVATGPTQSGKTLAANVIPLLYHLFEIGETLICGLSDMDMAIDKWREDILPALEQSRFRDPMPRQGGGSRGGRVESLQLLNGATLKFMSGGGGDKSRAGFTARVVVITETDGMDRPGTTSRESDKITQLEARTRGTPYRPAIGRGTSQQRAQHYNRPTSTGAKCAASARATTSTGCRANGWSWRRWTPTTGRAGPTSG